MHELISDACHRPWMGVYLRVLSVLYGYGALVHYANLTGFGELPWAEAPLSWRIGDVVYAPLDTVAAVGLWLKRTWGVACFLVGALSQIVLYAGFPDWFALTDARDEVLSGMVTLHIVTLVIFAALVFAKK